MTVDHAAGHARAQARHAAFLAGLPKPSPEPISLLRRTEITKPAGVLASLDEWAFVSRQRLARDTFALFQALPPDIDAVVAISRSGFLPGADLAAYLHLPLISASKTHGVLEIGGGDRLTSGSARESIPKHVLVIDDTVANGRTMKAILPIVQAAYPTSKITRAAIYVSPRATHAVDLFVSLYPGRHYLEWNWVNSGHAERIAFDFDGIICRDFTIAECATPESYRLAMQSITPLYLPRRKVVPLIVTARPESTRALTETWLERWGVVVGKLVMRDWGGDTIHDHDPTQIAQWKAKHFLASGCSLFAESDPFQAETIAKESSLQVLCPQAERVFFPVPSRPSLADLAPMYAKVNACAHRGCKRSCQKSECTKFHKDVYLSDCVDCVRTESHLEAV